MKLNFKFYKGKDICNNKDEDNKILNFIKSKKSLEEIFSEDCSWPIYYNLSNIRKNILSWYPFKKNSSILEIGSCMGAITPFLCETAKRVVCVEPSKKHAEVIDLRTKEFDNGEIFVGNFSDIVFTEKFDYITFIGSFNLSPTFTSGEENPYTFVLDKARSLLKPNGKILIATDNRFGLKYWLGVKDRYTEDVFGGINNSSISSSRTFSRNELDSIFEELNFKSNFYYALPDYRFTEIILSDEILKDNPYHTYTPYYDDRYGLFANEKELFDTISKNREISFFANSYFIELSLKECDKEVTYAKFNNYRCKKYALLTYKKSGKFFKKPIFKESINHVNDIYEYSKLLNNMKIDCVKVEKTGEECFTNDINMNYTLMDELVDLYINHDYKKIYKEINLYIDFLLKSFAKSKDISKTIFEQLDVAISEDEKSRLNFIEDGYIDLCFQNIFKKSKKYIFIDQEWYFQNVPVEYIVYRSILLFVCNYLKLDKNSMIFKSILDNIDLNLKQYIDSFDELNQSFMNVVCGIDYELNTFKIYNGFINYNNSDDISNSLTSRIYNYDSLNSQITSLHEELEKSKSIVKEKDNEIANLKKCNNDLKEHNENLSNEFNKIVNSKTWKLRNKICKIIRRK